MLLYHRALRAHNHRVFKAKALVRSVEGQNKIIEGRTVEGRALEGRALEGNYIFAWRSSDAVRASYLKMIEQKKTISRPKDDATAR